VADGKATLMSVLPASMDPEPIGRIAKHGFFQGKIHVAHDGFDRTRLFVFARGNFFARFYAPSRQSRYDSKSRCAAGNDSARQNGRRRGRVTIPAKKRYAHAFRTLVGQ
jgi:hypothetical protein